MIYILHTDGGSRGNPGPAASGYLLYKDDYTPVAEGGEYLGRQTNNFAEYMGLIAGLKLAIQHDVKELVCKLDSELVVKQVNGVYKVKHPDIKPLYEQVRALIPSFEKVTFTHVLRADNAAADAKVNEVLDSQ